MRGYWQRPDETAKVMTPDAYKQVAALGKRLAAADVSGRCDGELFADAVTLCLEKLPPKQFPKVETPKDDPPGDGPFKSLFKEKKPLKVLVIDGEGAKGRQEKVTARPCCSTSLRKPGGAVCSA